MEAFSNSLRRGFLILMSFFWQSWFFYLVTHVRTRDYTVVQKNQFQSPNFTNTLDDCYIWTEAHTNNWFWVIDLNKEQQWVLRANFGSLPYIVSPVFFQVLTILPLFTIPPFTPMNYQFFLNFLGLQNIIYGRLNNIDVYWKDREKRRKWVGLW